MKPNLHIKQDTYLQGEENLSINRDPHKIQVCAPKTLDTTTGELMLEPELVKFLSSFSTLHSLPLSNVSLLFPPYPFLQIPCSVFISEDRELIDTNFHAKHIIS